MSQQHGQTPPPADPAMGNGPSGAMDIGQVADPSVREQHDPRDGNEPISLWLVTAFGVLVFWGGWYLATYSGGFRGDVLDENPAAMYGTGGPPAAPLDPAVLGERLFASVGCVSCHMATGAGTPALVPPLAGSEWVLGEPARIKRVVLHGLSGPITVKGASFSAEMQPFGDKLKDHQLAAILTFIRGNSAWGNSASPVSDQSVAATRAATKGRTMPWSAVELLAITHDEVFALPPASTTKPATGPAAGVGR